MKPYLGNFVYLAYLRVDPDPKYIVKGKNTDEKADKIAKSKNPLKKISQRRERCTLTEMKLDLDGIHGVKTLKRQFHDS